ncbi:LuxR family transcriptional regulator [Actinomadura sp. KC06]|uniref:ATP-binding protein n=1 Tax=Actinomadura sp. KC06 TaxID=2530369 RepID=UPI0010500F39|nr:LuxR C-terminal-related transcriptional regulator [Actinomadura sp. KC06]TDD39954.1 LuxR family transcriptional regulator [Actinomadura sp. KC06]
MARQATLERQTGRLPAELTSFIGRDAELGRLRRLIDEHRLITLIGPAGVGKTRLAVRAATLVRDAFDDGVYFVGLSGLTEPSLLAQAICDALGLTEQDGEAAARLAEHLADRRVLLVLDTCEHLLDECAILTEALLGTAAGLHVLATSRQALDVAGEHTVPVTPLGRPGPAAVGLPDGLPDDLVHGSPDGSPDDADCDAVKLFAERAAAAVQGWTLTHGNRDAATRLCDRLDGIPLAIELAAVQLRAFSLDQVLGRLGTHLFQVRGRRTNVRRHQTLRAAVDWSHELCSAEERLLWARLSVFADGFDLDAAENVCAGDGLPPEAVVGALTGLVEKSIAQRADRNGQARYRMLDTLREYGAERLTELGGADRLRRRCFAWYAGLLHRARRELPSAAQARWLEWFDCERGNIRALLGDGVATAEPERLQEAMESLGRFWALRGTLGEGRQWADRVLETRDTTGAGWSGCLAAAALMMTLQNDLDGARELLDRALAQGRADGDQSGIALAHAGEGIWALFTGDFDLALRLLTTADGLYRESGQDDVLFTLIDVFRGVAHLFKGDFAASVDHADRAVRAGEESGELWVRSYGMLVCGLALWLAEDLDASMERLRTSLRIKRDLDDGLGMTLALESIAACLSGQGEPTRAVRLLGAADRLREFTQTSWFGPHHALLREIHTGRALEALGEERYRTALEEGRRLPLTDAIEDALGGTPSGAAAPSAGAEGGGPLTGRELEVAALVAEGLSNRAIAERLTIAKRTADSHVEHILAKLGFSSRAQIATWITARKT